MSATKSEKKESSSGGAMQFIFLFTLWYAFNAGYNVYNAHSKVFPYPITISVIQLLIGFFVYGLPLWILGIREAPRLTFSDIFRLLPIAALNALGHTTTVVAMFQKGGGSFAHVIKASEPVVSVILGMLINGNIPRPLTALSLLPISYGVAYASTLGKLDVATMSKELTSITAIFAMIGNVSFALRSIVRKNLTKEFKDRTRLTAANDHAITTILSAIITIPFILYYESVEDMKTTFASFSESNKQTFLLNLFLCGMCFYIYNEVQNMVLGSLGAVSTAVGNTLKRVVIFVALYFFTEGETFPMPKIIGCAIAIVGCLAYAILDSFKL